MKIIIKQSHIVYLIVLITVLAISLWYLSGKTRYAKVRESFAENKCVVYKLQNRVGVGLFSDVGFLTESYIRAKRANLDFYVDSSNWSYKHTNGWSDYFNSLKECPPNVSELYTTVVHCAHEKVDTSIDNNHKMYIKDYEKAIKEIIVFNDTVKQMANAEMTKYGVYESLFIRRGDKIISESPFKSTQDILNQCKFNNSLPLYVQSDDYTEIENVKSLVSNKRIVYMVPETKKGWHSSTQIAMTPEQKKTDTLEFLAGMYICVMSQKCYVDMLSNVGRFIKLYAPEKVEIYILGSEKPVYYSDKEILQCISYETSFM